MKLFIKLIQLKLNLLKSKHTILLCSIIDFKFSLKLGISTIELLEDDTTAAAAASLSAVLVYELVSFCSEYSKFSSSLETGP